MPTVTVTKYRAAALAALPVLILFWIDIGKKTVPLGLDGYYYKLQVDELIARGHLHYFTWTPLVFYIQAAVAQLTGDSLLAIQASTAIVVVGTVVTHYRLSQAYSSNHLLIAVCILVFCVAGPFVLFQTEFIKNLWGILFFLLSQLMWIRWISSRQWAALVLCLAMACCAALSHRLMAAAALCALPGWAMLSSHANSRRTLEILCRVGRFLVLSLPIAMCVKAVTKAWVLRTASSLGPETSISLTPLFIASLNGAAIFAIWRFVRAHPVDSVQVATNGILVCNCLVSFAVCLCTYIPVGVAAEEILDRIALTAYLISGPASLLVILEHIGSTRYRVFILSGCALLSVFSLANRPKTGISMANEYARFPATLSFSENSKLMRAQKLVAIAPHGIEFLLTSRYGIASTHSHVRDPDVRLYWFVWRYDCAVYLAQCQENADACVDLGPGQLISDDIYRSNR